MYYEEKRNTGRKFKLIVLFLSFMMILSYVGAETGAYIYMETDSKENSFNPANVSCEITEAFDGTEKTNVNVMNKSNITVYMRVSLVTYRINDDNQQIGGVAVIPAFTPGTGWFEYNGVYYYSGPVAPNGAPTYPLIGDPGITLVEYTDADGGKQVVEVMAEAVQAEGVDANGVPIVTAAWGVTVDENGNLHAPRTEVSEP